MESRRRKVIALILSGVFPGLGQFYNRQHIKGAVFLAAGVILSWLLARAAPTDLLTPVPLGADLIAPVSLLLAVWLWSVVDAWRIADR